MTKNNEQKERFKMHVLSAKDIQDIRGVSYSTALNYLKEFDYFYVNSRPYILASDFFDEEYCVEDVDFLQKIEGDNQTKVIKVFPLMVTVQDIQEMFQCGVRQSYEIMDLIPGMFKINTKRYVREVDFKNWLDSLPNQRLQIA